MLESRSCPPTHAGTLSAFAVRLTYLYAALQDCTGTPDHDSGWEEVGDSSGCVSTGKEGGSDEPAFGRHICNGDEVSIPFYNDASCTDEVDMNAQLCSDALTRGACTFPAHMTFTSGACTPVVSMMGMTLSWRITIKDCNSCEATFPEQLCEQLGPLAALAGGAAAIIIIIGLCALCWPCIIFGCAWFTCVSSKKKQGREPTGTAWAVCCGVFWLLVVVVSVFTGGLLLTWWWAPFVMIIPFCCDSCCARPNPLLLG